MKISIFLPSQLQPLKTIKSQQFFSWWYNKFWKVHVSKKQVNMLILGAQIDAQRQIIGYRALSRWQVF